MTPGELREVPTFADFPDHDLAVLSGIGRTLVFPVGSAIIEQGERARAAYVLVSGDVEVVRRLPGGTRTRLGILQRGAIFGAVALLDGGTRAATCLANTDAKVLELSADDFQRLVGATTPLGTRFLMVTCRQLVRDLRRTNNRIAELAGLSTLNAEDIAITLGSSLA